MIGLSPSRIQNKVRTIVNPKLTRKQQSIMKGLKLMIDYKFKENIIVNDVMDYVNKTYNSHYAQTKNYQATEIIIDQGHGTGFCMGNILKYAQRYGKKKAVIKMT